MKVQHNENIQKSLFPEKINKNENAQGIDFGAVLKNEVEKSSELMAALIFTARAHPIYGQNSENR